MYFKQKDLFLFVSSFFFIIYSRISAQHIAVSGHSSQTLSVSQPLWSANPENFPGHIKAFEENKGQFKNPVNTEKVLFGCLNDGITILFTERGVIYPIKKTKIKKLKEQNERGEDWTQEAEIEENLKNIEIQYSYLKIGWKNSNSHPLVEALDETPFYFGADGADHIKGFQKLIYHDVYPGIDVEYKFHPTKGIEYSVFVKPGIDASVFTMQYEGQQRLSIDKKGVLHIKTPIGDFLEYPPLTTQEGKVIESSFVKTANNEVKFKLGHYNLSSGLVIDPWQVSPTTGGFAPVNIGFDSGNNVYVLGAYNNANWDIRQFIQKYNTAGGLQWTYTLSEFVGGNSDYWLSDLAVSPAGDTYVATHYQCGGRAICANRQQYGVVSLNSAGTRTYWNCPAGSNLIFETWNLAYSCNYSTLIQGGCAPNPNNSAQAAVMSPANGSLGAVQRNNDIGEIYAGTVAPNGYYYALAADSNINLTTYTATNGPHNKVMCYNITGTTISLLWQNHTNYSFVDFQEHMPVSLGTNGIAAGCNYLYTSDGLNLDQRDLSNGNLIKRISIPSGNNKTAPNINSGIAVDLLCGYVYVGSKSSVYIYDANLNSMGTLSVGANNIVFDVKYNNGIVSVCGATSSAGNWGQVGQGFVAQFKANTCNVTLGITHTNASTCGLGTATANPTFCTAPYQYLWSPGGQTTQTITGLSAGIYTVQVSTQNSCVTVTDTVTIFNLPNGALFPTTTHNNVTCAGNDGSAIVTPNGGTGPYTYTWTPNVATGATATSLAVGTYTVSVKDAGGCSGTTTVVIGPASNCGPTVTAVGNAVCTGACTNISANPTGGTSPYTYTWSSGASGQTANVCPVGVTTYTVTLTDSKGLTTTATATVNINPPTTINSTKTDAKCAGASNGTATATPLGGTPTYTYTWSSGASGATATNLIKGTYTVTTTDSKSCTQTSTITIGDPAPVTASTTPVAALCGSSNGSASVSPGGGTGTYSFSWSNNTTGQTVSNLAAGTYTVTVIDANNCSQTATAVITNSGSTTVTASLQTNVSCFGGNNGSLTVNATGGTPGYTFSWSDGSSGQTATGLTQGTYTITVKDANGCTNTSTAVVTEPVAITGTTSATPAPCGTSNGTATINASGGTGGFTYLWSSGSIAQTATGLIAGTYTVTVTDANNCSKTFTAATNNIPPPSISSLTGISLACNGDNSGTLSVTVSGGTGILTYNWSNGNVGSTNVTGLAANTYSVTVTDASGCTAASSVTITEPPVLTLAPTSIATTCGTSNGSASVTAGGGNGTYTYNWSAPGGNTSTLPSLPAGSYTVTVSDAKGCTLSTTVLVNNIGASSATIAVQNNVSCSGGNNGSIIAGITGGTPGYTYSWSDGSTATTATNLKQGTYTVTITDANNCKIMSTATITEPPPLSIQFVNSNAACGQNNGSITATGTGGTGTITYTWSTTELGQTINNLFPGTYTVTITDANSCTSSSVTAISNIGAPSATTAVLTSIACNGGTGAVGVTANGGTPPYTYSWSNGASATTSGTADQISNMPSGTYTISVTDSKNCITISTVRLIEPDSLILIASSTPSECGKADGTTSALANGGTKNYVYNWSNGSAGANVANLTPNTYTVTVVDANNCIATTVVTVGDTTIAIINNNPATQTIIEGNSVTLTITGGSVYSWLPAAGLSCTDCPNPIAKPTETTTYTVTVTDVFGCSVVAMFAIHVRPPCIGDETDVFIANIFSPNNDGLNDILYVNGNGITNIYWAIYDRWGNLMFESFDKRNGWDGTYKGKAMDSGTYVYYLRATCLKTRSEVKLKGNVTIVR